MPDTHIHSATASLTLGPSMKRAERMIAVRARRSAAKVLKGWRRGPPPPTDRVLLVEMIRIALRLALAFESMRFGSRKISLNQLSGLVQDLLLHFDDLDLKNTSVWNLTENLLAEMRSSRSNVLVQHVNNPFKSFCANMGKFERTRKQADAFVFLLSAWSDLARCLAVCINAQVSAINGGLQFVALSAYANTRRTV